MIARWWTRCCIWLASWSGASLVDAQDYLTALRWYQVVQVPPVVLGAAREAVQFQNRYPADHAVGGEYKRHQVYAQLVKAMPTMAHRDIAMAIELAVRGL